MTTVSGIIRAIPANTSRQEPQNKAIGAPQEHNSNVSVLVGDYINTGNVPQTLKINGITNEQYCTFVSATLSKNGVNSGNQVTLNPNETASLTVVVRTATMPIGSPDTPFSYDVNAQWS